MRAGTSGRRASGVALVLVVVLAAAAACTRQSAGRAGGPPTAARSTSNRAELVRGDAGTTLAVGALPGELSVSASRALFVSAPVVVVALAQDAAGLQQGAARAAALGVPLLLDDVAAVLPAPPAPGTPPQAPPGEPAQGSPGAPALQPSDALVTELERLHPRAVLLVGAAAGLAPDALPAAAVTSAAALPPVVRASPTGTTVLVRADPDPAAVPGIEAAGATARAAGAVVVPVSGTDPRADPAAVAALAGASRVVAVGDFGAAEPLARRVAVAAHGQQLPGGGQLLFPGRRLVALYGTPGSRALGVLGEQGVEASISRAAQVAAPYRALGDVPVVPTFEIIATVASGGPGADGTYSREVPVEQLRPWVEQAGAAGMYVVLDLQPGRADFLTQAKVYEDLLRLPYVGLALDAEWRLTPTQVPLQQIGSVGIAEVNGVVTWLADLCGRERLPQKLLVLHQFTLSMIRDEAALDTSRDELALLVHMDGQGAPGVKDGTWSAVTRAAPPGVWFGWKDFYDEDTPMLTPRQTLAHQPVPVMVSYQ